MTDDLAPHIGTLGEMSLHAALKQWLAQPGDQLETRVDSYVIDILRGDLLIEVQTRSFAKMKRKLTALLDSRRVHVVHPIPYEKWIVRLDQRGIRVGRRKSPRRGRVIDVFRELVSFPEFAAHPHFTLEVLLIQQEEILVNDGRGSWRRKGWSIADRRLLAVLERHRFESPADFGALLPAGLAQPFDNKTLAGALGCPRRDAQRMTYCLRQMGAIALVGKAGRANLYRCVEQAE